MSNFSRYSVFLEVDPIRPIAWFLSVTGLILNSFLILFSLWESLFLKHTSRQVGGQRKVSIIKNPSFWLLFNLLISDLISSVYLFILNISDIFYTHYYQEKYGFNATFSLIKNEWPVSLTYYINLFLGKIGLFIAATMTLLIGVDRYILILYPHSNKKFNMKRVKIATMIAWIVCCIVSGGVTAFYATQAHYRSPYQYYFYLNLCIGDFYTTVTHTIVGFSELSYLSTAYFMVVTMYFIVMRKLRKSRLTFRSVLSSTFEKRFQLMFTLTTLTNVFSFFFISTASAINFIQTGTFTQISQFQKIITMLPYTNVAIDPILYIIFRFQDITAQLRRHFCLCRRLNIAVGPSKINESKSSDAENIVITNLA